MSPKILFSLRPPRNPPNLSKQLRSPKIPFKYYTALYYFVLMALGDTVSRRVPQYLALKSWRAWICGLEKWVTIGSSPNLTAVLTIHLSQSFERSPKKPSVLGELTSSKFPGWIVISIVTCIGGEAMNFLLIPIITGLAAFVAYFGRMAAGVVCSLVFGFCWSFRIFLGFGRLLDGVFGVWEVYCFKVFICDFL